VRPPNAAFAALALFHAGCGEKTDPVRSIVDRPPSASSGSPCWEKDIRPILEQRCYACHGADRPFDFSTLALVRLSLDPMRSKVRSEQMPPDGPLDTTQKSRLLRWIETEGPQCAP